MTQWFFALVPVPTESLRLPEFLVPSLCLCLYKELQILSDGSISSIQAFGNMLNSSIYSLKCAMFEANISFCSQQNVVGANIFLFNVHDKTGECSVSR